MGRPHRRRNAAASAATAPKSTVDFVYEAGLVQRVGRSYYPQASRPLQPLPADNHIPSLDASPCCRREPNDELTALADALARRRHGPAVHLNQILYE